MSERRPSEDSIMPGSSRVLFLDVAIWQPHGHDEWRASVGDEVGHEYAQVSVPLSAGPDALLDALRPYMASVAADFNYRREVRP